MSALRAPQITLAPCADGFQTMFFWYSAPPCLGLNKDARPCAFEGNRLHRKYSTLIYHTTRHTATFRTLINSVQRPSNSIKVFRGFPWSQSKCFFFLLNIPLLFAICINAFSRLVWGLVECDMGRSTQWCPSVINNDKSQVWHEG
jgi:hypothetical protein